MTNCTNEALLARRVLAEQAIAGPWEVCDPEDDTARGLGLMVMAACGTQRFHVASATYCGGKPEAAHIAANSPDVVMTDIDEILRLRAENERLEQEAEWLANRCHEFCVAHNWCAECPMCSGLSKKAIYECGAQIEQRFEKNMVQDWREAARKALKAKFLSTDPGLKAGACKSSS